jgi:hypothetical protein
MQRPRVVDIEQQIAHLRWRKQQNERSIRISLEATKVLKQKDTILGITGKWCVYIHMYVYICMCSYTSTYTPLTLYAYVYIPSIYS